MEAIDALEQAIKNALPQTWVQNYNDLLRTRHPNTLDLPLMNPFHVVLIVLGYFIAVFVGKAVMKNREKFELKTFSLVHNCFLIILSAYMAIEVVRQALLNNYSLFGNPLDVAPKGIGMTRVLWLFYFSKTIEFIDTGIMIMKKNFHQVTFLHMYHHATIFSVWWVTVYYVAGADAYFSAAQNSFVHVLMYSYYLLSSLNVKIPGRYKNFLTIFQMSQFAINMIFAGADVVLDTAFPKHFASMLFWYMVTLLALFLNFFLQSQRRDPKKDNKKEQ